MRSNSFLKEGMDQPLGDIMALVLMPLLYVMPIIFLLLPLLVAYLIRSPYPVLRWGIAFLIVIVDLLSANIFSGQSEWWNIFTVSKHKHNGEAMLGGLWAVCFFLWPTMISLFTVLPDTR